MANNTFINIATTTVGSGGASDITFSSIPSTYTDLQLLLSLRTSTATYQIDQIKLRFNGSTASNYSYKDIVASSAGATAQSNSSTDYWQFGYAPRPQATASTFGNTSLYIPNYTSSSNKSGFSISIAATNGTGDYWYMRQSAGLWSVTSAITSIAIYSGDSGGFAQYSTATLYGINNS